LASYVFDEVEPILKNKLDEIQAKYVLFVFLLCTT
jgi:hypothetical protein